MLVAIQPKWLKKILDGKKMKKYFIIDDEGGRELLFWRPNREGYTTNLKEAGIYDGNEEDSYPIIDKNNLKDIPKSKPFYIDINDIELLGNLKTISKIVVNRNLKLFNKDIDHV